MRATSLALLVCLLSVPAWGAAKFQDCATAHLAGTAITSPKLGPTKTGGTLRSVCWDSNDGTDMPTISLRAAISHVYFDEDVDTEAFGAGAECVIERILRGGATESGSVKVLATLDGNPVTDTEGIVNLVAGDYRAICTNAGNDKIRLEWVTDPQVVD